MTPFDAAPDTNYFLNYLPTSQRAFITARCTRMELMIGDTLNTAGLPIKYVYFPITGFVSLETELVDKQSIEIGLIGYEGMLGASLALGNKCAPMTSVVQGAGIALRMDADLFYELVEQHPQIRSLVLNYLYVLMQQLTQISACNKFHAVKQRLPRWLLITQDRTHDKHLQLTHDFLGKMLGVRHSAITIAAGLMRQQGAISCSRGQIIVLSREALEKMSCGCYGHAINAYNKNIIRL